MVEESKTNRFALRPDRRGWTVYEVWTSEPAVIAPVPQTGLSELDAQPTADLLNRRVRAGDRSMRQ
jgi:hypothetical protein